MFDYNENLALSKILMSKKNPSGKYSLEGKEVSYDSLEATLANNLRELTHTDGHFDAYKYNENKNTIYKLLGQTLDAVYPKRVLETYGMLADIQTVPQGDKVYFKRKIGKTRGKQFITRVGMSGRYEVFEIGEERFEIKTNAYGGAARIGIEEFLDGRVQWSDYLEVIDEGMSDAFYREVEKALVTSIEKMPAMNKYSTAGFSEEHFDNLIATVSAYGDPTIYCTLEAAKTLVPAEGYWSSNMKDEYWRNKRFLTYKGTPIVVLPQSFEDETNATKVIDPSYIHIIPSNGEKPVKMVIEGNTLVKEFENRDWSTELQTYQKFGVGVISNNNRAVYQNTALSKINAN